MEGVPSRLPLSPGKVAALPAAANSVYAGLRRGDATAEPGNWRRRLTPRRAAHRVARAGPELQPFSLKVGKNATHDSKHRCHPAARAGGSTGLALRRGPADHQAAGYA